MNRAILIGAALCAAQMVTISAQAEGFEWGETCSSGNGEFEQFIEYYTDVTVGEIPAGKANVEIQLQSPEDVDVRLIDTETGHQIISWPNGNLNGASQDCTIYQNVEYCYSGYNGNGTDLGHEWIRINGETNRPLTMSAFGYRPGEAVVNYSFTAPEDCIDAGNGSFAQWIAQDMVVTVGDIPAGKTNIDISLKAQEGRDVDIQLFDGETKIIAWDSNGNHGLLNGPNQQTIQYDGLQITYSGYNGRNGDWGQEDIRISGTLPRTLTMKVFGYQWGFADVDYAWGHGQLGDSCGGHTITPAHPCQDELVCKGTQLPTDLPGTCQAVDYCESQSTADSDCGNLLHVSSVGSWACENNTCSWESTSPDVPEITLEQLAANPSTWANQMVEINAQATVGFPMCTKMFCGPANPCCNNCNASLVFQPENSSAITLTGLSCNGNECNYESNCPFANGAWIKVQAWVRVQTIGLNTHTRLEVTSSEAMETPACYVGGCSSQVCSANPNVITTCEYLPEYACLEQSQCGNYGAGGGCAWESSSEYMSCLDGL